MKLRCRNTQQTLRVEILEAPFARDTGNKRAPVTSGQPGDYLVHFKDGPWCCKRELIEHWGDLITDDAA